jgi:hypothetical protein
MDRRQFAGLVMAVAASGGAGAALAADKAPQEWDGLRRVKSKRMKYVWLAPGVDFRPYHRVMLDPTEIAFAKNWQRDYNSSRTGLGGRVSDADVQKAITEGGKAATAIFAKQFAQGGYPTAAAPAPDVLRVRTAIVNITVTAPDIPQAGRSYQFSNEAGGASLIMEARDSVTGALLGRVADGRLAGDTAPFMRNSVSNRADFEQLIRLWASNAVKGVTELKAQAAPAG